MEEKKPKCSDHDYLLDLPEGILHHILSYLPMKDVIKTSSVAKRWRYVWLYVPCLNFGHLQIPETAFVNRSLVLHKALEIQKLSISLTDIMDSTTEAYDIQSWILFAATRNVKELHLNFYGRHKVVLPRCIFSCVSLTVLELCGCFISTSAEFKLTSLKSLTLEMTSHGWEHAQSILASSPSVEHLSLINCLGETSEKIELSILNAGVKNLYIKENVSETPDIKVNAPFVVSFDLITSMRERNVVLNRMKSLECVTLALSCDARNNILKILYSVGSVKALRLSRSCFKAISEIDERYYGLLSFKFTHLELSSEGLSKAEQGRIASVLKLSPKIRTLVITIEGFRKTVTVPDGGHLKLKDPDVLQNLETVKIYGFMKHLTFTRNKNNITAEELLGHLEDDLSFLEALLKSSKALKRMTIKIYRLLRIDQMNMIKLRLLVNERLLAFPKASGVGISLS